MNGIMNSSLAFFAVNTGQGTMVMLSYTNIDMLLGLTITIIDG